MEKIKVALCQIQPDFDIDKSFERAKEMISEAATNGAKLISLPEIFYYPYDLNKINQISGKEDFFLSSLIEKAKNLEVYLCTGSMVVKREKRLYNMSHLIGPDGTILGKYCKCHLYDADLDGKAIRESDVFSAGDNITVVKTPIGTIGMMICYDIRFPEMARLYAEAGVEILLVPSVFNSITGKAHWHVMMKARAIENQIYLIAVSQAKNPESSYSAYGHSLVATPWGDIICEASEEEEIKYCILDPEILKLSRNRLPLLSHRRKDIYDLVYKADKK